MWFARVHLGEQLNHFRPRFTVRSLMVVVAVAGLISSVTAYEQRLKGRARYHEARYLEHITPITPTSRIPGVPAYSARLLDGTWTVRQTKTPEAEWHEQKKWEYHHAIVWTNFLLIAALVGSVSLWLVGKLAFGWLQLVHRER